MAEKTIMIPKIDVTPLRSAIGEQAFRADVFAPSGQHIGVAYGSTAAMARANGLTLYKAK